MDREENGRNERAVRQYGPSVYRLAFSQLRNRQDAEDVYQEVFLRYVEKAPAFEDPEHEKAWLLRVTVNCCKDIFRSLWRKRNVPLDEARELPFFTREEQDLRRELFKLSQKDRALLHLIYWEDLSTVQAASVLGCKPAAVRQRLTRARKKLKKILEEEESGYVPADL